MVLSEIKPSNFLSHFSGEGLPDFEGSSYFNARWYDADTVRFITEDPARDGLLWYAYCNNNPMTFIDPTGMWRTLAERKQDKADKARENGNTERADRLDK